MVINCIGGIGDILYCEPIFKHFFIKEGIRPTVVINDHDMYVQDYISSAKFLAASKYHHDRDSDQKTDKYLPLRFANPIMNNLFSKWDYSDYENCMPDKYKLAGLDPELWKTLEFQFDLEKARQLFAILDINSEMEYIVVNENCRAGNIQIETDPKYKRIHIVPIEGYNILDWAMVMFLAKENHHVSTCTYFILEALKDYKGKTFIYARPNEDGLRGISKLIPTKSIIEKTEKIISIC